MQHGAVLLAASPATPSLPGIQELTGIALTAGAVIAAAAEAFVRQTGWRLAEAVWTAEEQQGLAAAAEKYASAAWMGKR